MSESNSKTSGRYLDGLTPDSLSGLILGFEGIRNSLVILNGPTGCKFYHSITAENQSIRKDDYDPLNYPDEWFFGQRRVPCTYLDKHDYVYGSEGKLTDAIRFILNKITPDVLIVVNSPGAALIGDDLERIANAAVSSRSSCNRGKNGHDRHISVITCQSPGYSKDVIDGYNEACRTVIDKLCLSDSARESRRCLSDSEQEIRREKDLPTEQMPGQQSGPSVNLLGLSIYQKYHTGDIAELKKLLSLCGIRTNMVLLCESSVEEIEKIKDASLNIVVDADWGLDAAEYLKETLGTPYVVSEYGYPVGFKAMEKLIRSVCSLLAGCPATDMKEVSQASPGPDPAIEELEKARARAYVHLARISSLTGLPKGAKFAVYGTPALKRGYSSFLTEYLGMEENEDDPEIVLADGNTIARMKAERKSFSGIETALPSIGYIDVIDKTHVGADGGLFLIEQILNGFVY